MIRALARDARARDSALAHPDDLKLLLRAQALGYLSQADAALCLDELAGAELVGKPMRLAQLLLQKRLVTSREIVAALVESTPTPHPFAVKRGTDATPAVVPTASGQATTVPAPEAPVGADSATPGGPGGPVVGEVLGGYELIREVARGGMGVLFEARRRGGGTHRFAVKVLSARATANAQLLQRFKQEGALAAQLEHPNVVKVHEVNQDRGRHFLVMDYFDGRSLAELLKAGRLSPRKAVEVIATVARAAGAMHERKVIHRDLKPGNILVGKKGHVCVTDFGVAKDLARTDPLRTQPGFVIGTPAYMAPEQARGELDRVGPWSDVYSLGATLYRALSGKYPYDADSVLAAIQKIAKEEPPPLERHRPDVPPELARIVGRAMARDIAARPSAGELADLLDDFLASGPVLMPPAPPNPDV